MQYCNYRTSPPNHRQVPEGECGAVMLLAVFAIVAGLAVVALVVDAGNLYRSRALMQNAADAAAVGAVLYANGRTPNALELEAGGGTDQHIEDYLRTKAIPLVRSYLSQGQISDRELPDTGIELDYEPQAAGATLFSVRVRLNAEIDNLLLQYLPAQLIGMGGTDGSTRVAVAARSRRKIANIAILFDTSRSMGCPAEETGQDCKCLTKDRDPAAAGCAQPTRIDKVIDGLKGVAGHFNTSRDNLIFVPFNTTSVAVDVNFIKEQLKIDKINPIQVDMILNWIKENFQPDGSTNICDALIRGHQKMEIVAPQQEVAYVLISDGAATATRFLFSDNRNLQPWSKLKGAAYDYTQYSLTWSTSIGNFPGPGLLVQTDMLGLNHRWVEPDHPSRPPAVRPDPNAEIAKCGPNKTPIVASHYQYTQAIDAVFEPCVKSLAFQIPGDGRVYGAEYKPGGAKGFERFQEQYYNCPIAYAEYLRRNQATVHVLGYGNAAAQTVPRTGDDPYQSATESNARKDYFLAKMANSYVRGVAIPKAINQVPYPEFPGIDTYEDWNEGKKGLDEFGSREGSLYTTPDLSQVDQLFSQIAQQITVSLIE